MRVLLLLILIGFEQQFPRNFVVSLRYQDRRIKRIVEDAALVSPESADFFGQAYFIFTERRTV